MKRTLNMRRASFVLGAIAIAAGLLQLSSCKKDEEITPELEVAPATATVLSSGGEAAIDVTCNMDWTVADASTSTDWYSVSPKSGKSSGTVVVSVEPNPDTLSREVVLTFTAGSLTKTSKITQDALGKSLVVNPDSLAFVHTGEAKTFTITSNVAWTLTSSAAWCTLDTTSGSNNATITVTAAANDTLMSRVATITISAAGMGDRKVSVGQAAIPATMSLSVDTLLFNDKGVALAADSVLVTSNAAWAVTQSSGSNAWCTVSPASGTGNKKLTVALAANNTTTARTATVTIVATGNSAVSASFTVVQAPEIPVKSIDVTSELTADPNSWRGATVGADAGTIGSWLGVYSNPGAGQKWQMQLTSGAYRCASADVSSVAGNYELWLISPAINLDSAAMKTLAFQTRVAHYESGSSLEVYLLDSKAAPSTPNPASKLSFFIPTGADTAAGRASEFLPSGNISLSGIGVKYVGFRYRAAGKGGSGQSTVYSIQNLTFGVTPKPLTATLPNSLVNVPYTGATSIPVKVYSNEGDWTAVAPAWCTLSSTTGTNNGTFNVTVAANTESALRPGNITITSAVGVKNVAVSQVAAPNTKTYLASWNFDSVAFYNAYFAQAVPPRDAYVWPSSDGLGHTMRTRDTVGTTTTTNGLSWNGSRLTMAGLWNLTAPEPVQAFYLDVNAGALSSTDSVRVEFSVYAAATNPRYYVVEWSADKTTWANVKQFDFGTTPAITQKFTTPFFKASGLSGNKLYIRIKLDPNNLVRLGGQVVGATHGVVLATGVFVEKK